jgi:hypothetical protein
MSTGRIPLHVGQVHRIDLVWDSLGDHFKARRPARGSYLMLTALAADPRYARPVISVQCV